MAKKKLVVSKKVKSGVPKLVETATQIVVTNEVENQVASDFMNELRLMKKTVEGEFLPSVDSAKLAYDEVRKLRDKFLTPIKESIGQLKNKMSTYMVAESNRRLEIARKAQEIARKATEEANRKAEEEAKKTGMPVIPTIPTIQTPVIAVTPVKTAGATLRTTWSAEVVSLTALAKAVAEGRADATCILPNMSVLNAMAVAKKEEGFIVTGVKAVKKQSVVGR